MKKETQKQSAHRSAQLKRIETYYREILKERSQHDKK